MGGRVTGTLNKATLLKRDNLISVLEVCRKLKTTPPEILAEGMLLIRQIALSPVAGAKSVEEQNALIASLPDKVRDRLVKYVMASCDIASTLMEYGYPKLARVEHTGADGGAIQLEQVNVIERVLIGPTIDGQSSRTQ